MCESCVQRIPITSYDPSVVFIDVFSVDRNRVDGQQRTKLEWISILHNIRETASTWFEVHNIWEGKENNSLVIQLNIITGVDGNFHINSTDYNERYLDYSPQVIDGLEVLDQLEKIPVNPKNFRPNIEKRINSVTIHANPFAKWFCLSCLHFTFTLIRQQS